MGQQLGFFGTRAQFSGDGDFERLDDGTYKMVLKEIKSFEVDGNPKFNQDPSQKYPKFRWIFQTVDPDHADSTGRPIQVTKTTGTSYGNENAALTQLLNSMLGLRENLTPDQFGALDIEELQSRHYKVQVELYTGSNGKDYNNILSVKPWTEKAQRSRELVGALATAREAMAERYPEGVDPASIERQRQAKNGVVAGDVDELGEIGDPFAKDEE